MDTYGREPKYSATWSSKKMKAFLVRVYIMLAPASGCMAQLFSLLPKPALLLLCVMSPVLLHAETISGTVFDPSGAVIVGARIEISGGDLSQPIIFSSDERGRFVSPDLKPGNYSLRVTREGFEPLVKTVDLHGIAELELKLAIAKQRETVTVLGKGRAYANTDPIYRQLRTIGLGQSFRFDDFTVELDVATLHFQKGTLTLLNPVNGVVTGAIYIGEGHLKVKPATALDTVELKRRSGGAEFEEDFSEVVFRFTGDEQQKFAPGMKEKVETSGEAVSAF